MNKVCLGRALVQVVDALAPRLRVAERARLRARKAGLVVALVGARGGVRLRVRVRRRVRVGTRVRVGVWVVVGFRLGLGLG